MKYNLIINFILITLTLSNEIDKEWNLFKMKYSKQYKTQQEEIQRKQIFQTNYNKILQHNKHNPSYTQGINYYSDYNDEELVQLTKKTSNQRFQQWKTVHNRRQFHLPKQQLKQQQEQNIPMNYSLCTSEAEYNYCGSLIIDQGNCVCCYAAGVAHQLSTLYSYHLHHLNNSNQTKNEIQRKLFSIQQLIDCNSFKVLKALILIDSTVFGKLIVVNTDDELNALSPIVLTPFKVIVFAPDDLNTLSPID